MRALLILRADASPHFGGDVVQARSTSAALRALGVEADVVETEQPDARGYDIGHVFGIGEADRCARQIAACRSAGARVALSPIWLDFTEVFGTARACERELQKSRTPEGAADRIGRIRRRSPRENLGYRERIRHDRREAQRASLLRSADVLLPNSAVEARNAIAGLHAHDMPFVIVPNGVEVPPIAPAASRRGVVCAARVETVKNQAMLLLGLRDDPIDVTIVGEAYDRYYLDICKQWAGPRTRFLGKVPRSEALGLMVGARVHAMPSWIETTGLSSLEAALLGTQLVVGDRGAEVEYFGSDAEYADPSDPASIRAAVLRALDRPERSDGDALARRVRALTWEAAARATLRGYEIALRGKGRAVAHDG